MDDSISIDHNLRKRKLSSDDENSLPSSKIRFYEENVKQCTLLDLSDEILLEITRYLDHISLISLGGSCARLQNFILDKNLWVDVDFTLKPTMKKDLKRYLKYITPDTKSLQIRGTLSLYPHDAWKNLVINKEILEDITSQAPNLQSMTILESTFSVNEMRITSFPSKLKCLEIIKSEPLNVRDYRSEKSGFFAKMETHLMELEKLSLENCSWFEVHDFIVFSKLPRLKHLNLKGCQNLRDGVPYCSISTRFGFKTLEILDVRDTPISDSDIQCFNITNTLRELYMDCPSHLRNQTNSNTIQPSSPSDFQNFRDSLRNRLINHPVGRDNVIVYVLDARELQPVQLRENGHQNNENNNRNQEENAQQGNHGENVQNVEIPAQQAAPIAQRRSADAIIFRNAIDNNEIRHINSILDNRNLNPLPLSLISDRALLSFGLTRNNSSIAMVWIRAQPRSPNTYLEILHVRNYKLVTDVTLRHLATCSPNLKVLDVTGTSVTINGITEFKQAKPECKIISHIEVDD